MIKNLNFTTFALCALCLCSLSSCKDDKEIKTSTITASIDNSFLFFNSEGVWSDWNKSDNILLYPESDRYYDPNELSKIQFEFTHFYAGYPYGFTASKVGGNQYYAGEMYNHQFSVMPGNGDDDDEDLSSNGISPFIVANWDAYTEGTDPSWKNRSCLITVNQRSFDGNYYSIEFEPKEVEVTNTCYTYYSILNGDSFAKKFEKGDYLKLIAHGVKSDNTEKTVEFYLADCKGSDTSKWFVTTWKSMDLSSMGSVKAVYFTMESSDTGAYGMNTPAYFAITDFEIVNKYFQINID